ncbi:hypothetical protein M407DRAFT_25791 [Tulasnella calospora MUT 4182]|uniref:BTB domain-containing protein n=1 Tax=Tulasnella calospora MUT 4182 TaxID=1051891 RepID=A0A0C3Q6B1_9AGAM|nr:hypothetical protein M407DRAFT_25791 [Tulasnella calospora MUT 4182]
MFALPSADNGGKDQNDGYVIPVEEDAATLQVLLQMIYPIDPPPITSFPLAQKLVTACNKYFMSTAKLRLYLRSALNDDQFMKEDPLACYGLLWKLGWEEEAIRASRYTHTFQLTDTSITRKLIEHSEDIEALLHLLRLKDNREEALDNILSLVKANRYYVCSQKGHAPLSINFKDYNQRKAELRQKLKAPYPDAQDVEDFLGFNIPVPRTDQWSSVSPCETCLEGRTARLQAIRSNVITALEAYPQTISG